MALDGLGEHLDGGSEVLDAQGRPVFSVVPKHQAVASNDTIRGVRPADPDGRPQIVLNDANGNTIPYATPRANASLSGIVADGRLITTTITAGNSFCTAVTGTITAAEVGKLIGIIGAGPNRNALVGKISGFTPGIGGSNDTIALGDLATGAPITASYGNGTLRATYLGTDSTAALQTLINTHPAGTIDLPAGDICISDTIDFNSVSYGGTGKGKAFYLYGQGSGRDSISSAATRILNFGSNEALLSARNDIYGLHVGRLGVFNLVDIGQDTATIFLTNQYGQGHWEDITICSSTPSFNTFVTGAALTAGSSSVTGVGASAPNNGTWGLPKIGDYPIYWDGPSTTVSGAGQAMSATPFTLTVVSTTGLPTAGTLVVPTTLPNLSVRVTYTGTTGTTFTGCTIPAGSFVALNGGKVGLDPVAIIPAGTRITAIDEVAGTLTLDHNAALTATGVKLAWLSPNSGHGFWVDNPAAGQQEFQRIDADSFMAPPSGSFGGGDGIRFSAQVYGPIAVTGSVDTTTTIRGINTFVGWWPGALVSGVGVQAGAQILRVNRAKGTAVMSLPGTGDGTSRALNMSASGVNSGNMQFTATRSFNCANGLHGLRGALTNGSVFSAHKSVTSAPVGKAGLWIEVGCSENVFIAPHLEGHFNSVLLDGCTLNKVITPMLGSRIGIVGDGSVGVLARRNAVTTATCFANEVGVGFLGGGWDTYVSCADSGTTENEITTRTVGFSAGTQKYVDVSGLNRIVDTQYRAFRSRMVTPLGWGMSTIAFTPVANTLYLVRAIVPETGLLKGITTLINTTSGNLWLAVYDVGEALAGNYSRLWDSGSVACAGTAAWQGPYDPNVPVIAGQHIMLGVMVDNTTVRLSVTNTQGAFSGWGTLPSGYLANLTGMAAKYGGIFAVGSFTQPPAAIAEASLPTYNGAFNLIARV